MSQTSPSFEGVLRSVLVWSLELESKLQVVKILSTYFLAKLLIHGKNPASQWRWNISSIFAFGFLDLNWLASFRTEIN